MKLRTIGLALVAMAAIGVLAFLLRMTQSVDGALHLERLARLRALDNLDVQFNRAITQAGVSSLDGVADQRAVVTSRLGEALDGLEQGPRSLRGLSAPLDQALDRFVEAMETKFGLGFDFEARSIINNQRLIVALEAVPLHAAALSAAAGRGNADATAALLASLRTEVTSYGVVLTPTNEAAIRGILNELSALAPGESDAFQAVLAELSARCEEIFIEKRELIERVEQFLGGTTAEALQQVEQAYVAWHEAQLARADGYRVWLAGYAAALLAGLALLGLRLSRSYRDLDRANDELSHANEHLEEQVEARTHDLSAALDRLRASQAQLIQSEKMASLGQMVAGVAHEINTPLGYARSNADILRDQVGEIGRLLQAQTRALRLMTSEQASDEQVAAALAEAEELRDSLMADELVPELDKLLVDTAHGLSQISELVLSLKDFSRVDRSRSDLFNVNDGLDSALKIGQNQLKHRVEVIKSYGRLPQIECSPSQLNQVFLNLITNAAQAIGETASGKGRIYLHTAAERDGVAIRILDTGCGMSEEVRSRIFEPFFTTKPVGKGTGLGLSIVFRIVEDHGGRIAVRSNPGKGSEFTIHLPLRQARRPETAAAPAASAAPGFSAELAAA